MILNNLINHLKQWCINKAEAYQRAYGGCGGFTYVGYQVAFELEFKLSTLIDKSFDNLEDFKREVLSFMNVHYEPSVIKPQNSTAEYIIDKTNQEFLDYLDNLIFKTEELQLAELPYTRVIVGSEAMALQDRFLSVWGYENTSCWYPLAGDEPQNVSEKFFVMFDYFEPYMKQFEQMIGLPKTHIYRYGENNFRPQHCIEAVELDGYDGAEMIYTDKEFTWAVYFSHESTVAFAGALVPNVKELLLNEKEHWNKFEYDF